MFHHLAGRLISLVLLGSIWCAPVLADDVRVIEVSMAAPDILHVELRDPDFVRGHIVALDQPRSEPNGTWIDVDGTKGMVVGPKRDHLRLADTPPQTFLDRGLVDDATLYHSIGSRRVVAVYRKSMPYASGLFATDNGETRSGASMRHDIYLLLDGDLEPGPHQIAWPRDMLTATPFVLDPDTTRASAIHLAQTGYRGTDLAKIAFLSLWLPGGPDQGAVDFRRYGVNSFDIIDASGEVVFSGPIRLRAEPDSPEPGNGLAAAVTDYVDASAKRVALSGLDGVVLTTTQPHGFAQGQRIALERLAGEQDGGAVFATIGQTTATTFRVDAVDGTLPESLMPGATAVVTHKANRAGTFVFELNFSNWKPADGIYRLRLAGLGVSDPLVINERVWRQIAQASLEGLYHHRSGMRLDGRFGYERPASFRPGSDFTVYHSRLPLSWSSDYDGGFIPFSEGVQPGWITPNAAPANFWGGYMDAGDWDRRIQNIDVSALLLDTYELLPPDEVFETGLPLSNEALDPIYDGSDALPGLIHEVIWGVDFFRRLQAPDGSIHGGIESAEHPLKGEPSFLEHYPVFVFAPDLVSTYRYAAVAADLARVLENLDQAGLAEVYRSSAMAAWKAAEGGFANPDAFYADAIVAGTKAGAFADVSWAERKISLQQLATAFRSSAAAALFRLTDEQAFAEVFEAQWHSTHDIWAYQGDAAWDYRRAKNGDAAIAEDISDRIVMEADVIVEAQSHLAYPSLKHPDAPAGWGQGGAPGHHELQTLIRAHQITGDPNILIALERGQQAMLGANQLGLSLTTGLGVRSVANPLHEDSLAMGVPAPRGITIYGWGPQNKSAFGWIFGPPWSPLPEVGNDENAQHRRIEPSRFALPYFEYLVEHPAMVMQQEYTVQQSIATMAAMALYIDAQ